MPPEPDPKPTFSEQVADILLKVVMAGGVAGGGLGAFWSLFKDSDIPKAIASAGIGLGISYAAKLLQPVDEGNRRRLERAGRAMDRVIDRAINQVIIKFCGFEDRYLRAQALDCTAYRSEGMAPREGIFTPILEDVFVPLVLATDACVPGFRALVAESLEEANLDDEPLVNAAIANSGLNIWQILARTEREPTLRQIVILAWGGYGKTTLLKHIAYIYGKKQHSRYSTPQRKVPKRIPVLLLLRKYRDLLSQAKPPDLPKLITQHHLPSLPGAADLQVPTHWANDLLDQGKAIVMLDGFDEVPIGQRPAVSRWIHKQMQCYDKSTFILTSRPKAYKEQDAADRLEMATPFWVQDFNPKQRQQFVRQWYRCQERHTHGRDDADVQQMAEQAARDVLNQIEARPELKDLAKNPLLLNMIVTFHRRYPSAELPKRRVELYKEICWLQLRDRPGAKKLETLLTQSEAQTILQMLALEMMQQRQERIDRDAILSQLDTYLRAQGENADAQEFLKEVVEVSELLVEREPEEYEFAHLSFQEYLAATQIRELKQEALLYDYFDEGWWKPTILLYAAQIKNPSTLIREMLARGATDLAYTCYQETTKRLDPALEAELRDLNQTVQTSRYQQLEAYLQNQQWKKADYETYRLMITTVGKEEGQYFTNEELLNFPCEELLTIDRLWVQYSRGLFGFSVQKQIYVECGGKLDGRYPEIEIWEAFGDRVGWRQNGEWLSYDDLNPSFSSPKGNLPLRGLINPWGLGVVLSSLASRLVKCKA